MSKNVSLLQRVKNVGAGLRRVARDPGVLFSGLHAIAFSRSFSEMTRGLGFASLALTLSISVLRKAFPDLNKRIAPAFNKNISDRLYAPRFDANGFPLFINGIVLTGVALSAFVRGDFTSGTISLFYAMANTDKGARIPDPNAVTYKENLWTIEGIGKKIFNTAASIVPAKKIKTVFNSFAEKPPRFLKHGLYLAEFWGAAGALTYALSHSGPMAIATGGIFAAFAVVAAGSNNNDAENPATHKIPLVGKAALLSDKIQHALSGSKEEMIAAADYVLARRFMKYGSGGFFTIAVTNAVQHYAEFGDIAIPYVLAATAHLFGVGGNSLLESLDFNRQKQVLAQLKPAI